MVESVQVMSVADLYIQFATYARHYDLADNPLKGITGLVPRRALYYVVVPANNTAMAEAVMKRLAGRRKLRSTRVHKDEIKHSAFSPTQQMMVIWA